MKEDLTELQIKFLDALFGAARGNRTLAGEIAGVADPHSMCRRLKDVILERSREQLAMAAPTAVFVLEDSMDENASVVPGIMNRLAGAKEVLDRAGITKKDTIDLNGQQIGLVLLPAKDVKDAQKSE